MPGSNLPREEARALLPAEDPEAGAVEEAQEAAPVEKTVERESNWQENFFPHWRGMFLYKRNCDFAESFEISFRGAVWLLLFGTPAIWGLDKDPDSFFYKGSFQGKMFQTGALVPFVYTLAPTIGITLSNAVHGVAGTLTAATFSWLMYAVFPDGCGGADAWSLCYFFGVVVGAASIVCCLLLNLGTSFQVFYCANFVWFWMAFVNPDSPSRTAPDFPKEYFLGMEFSDWGGGVFDAVIKYCSGAAFAIAATLLPYPMTSMEQARDSAADIVNVLEKTWVNSVDFYLGNDRDDKNRAKMMSSMRSIKGHISTLKEHLGGAWWEIFFLGRCCGSFRSKHAYLARLEETTSRCFERLTHVVDACAREEFETVHDELMRPDRCGDAVRALTGSANKLLRYALKRADDGFISAEEHEELRSEVRATEEAERHLSKKMWESIRDINSEEALKSEQMTHSKSPGEIVDDVARQLSDEQIFMFSLCDFASSLQAYASWLADQHGAPAERSCAPWEGLRKIFVKDEIFDPTNCNIAARSSLAMFLGFAIGYLGYSELIPAKDATIPCTIAVLLSRSLSSPINKSLGRLQGVVLGKFYGKLAYALLGWCATWAQASLSAVVFSYAWLTLFIYHYSSPFSYLGCLAAAFGTQAFLVGCDDATVVTANAGMIVNMLIGIGLMVVVDLVLLIGRPSELAFGAYLDAWAVWDSVLERLLTEEDVEVDAVKITSLIAQAETLAAEAASEPRLWRGAFPKELFAEMIELARTMRTQVICIHTVVCEEKPAEDGSFVKKAWFSRMRKDPQWRTQIYRVLQEMDATHDCVERLQRANGERTGSAARKVQRESTISEKVSETRLLRPSPCGGRDALDGDHVSLVEDEEAQKNFVFGCLQSIKAVNYNLQLEILRRGAR